MSIFNFDLASIFSFTVSPLELMLRGSLVFWSFMLDFMSFHYPVVRRLTAAPRLCLVRDGKLLRRNMRRELITDEELNAKIRQEGIEDVANVKRMYLEADGEMSLIRRDEARAGT